MSDRVYPEGLIEVVRVRLWQRACSEYDYDLNEPQFRLDALDFLDAVFSWREGDRRVLVGERVGTAVGWNPAMQTAEVAISVGARIPLPSPVFVEAPE